MPSEQFHLTALMNCIRAAKCPSFIETLWWNVMGVEGGYTVTVQGLIFHSLGWPSILNGSAAPAYI